MKKNSEKIIELYLLGFSIPQIASKLNLNQKTVWYHLEKGNIKRREPGQPSSISESDLLRMVELHGEGYTLEEIGKFFNIDGAYVHALLDGKVYARERGPQLPSDEVIKKVLEMVERGVPQREIGGHFKKSHTWVQSVIKRSKENKKNPSALAHAAHNDQKILETINTVANYFIIQYIGHLPPNLKNKVLNKYDLQPIGKVYPINHRVQIDLWDGKTLNLEYVDKNHIDPRAGGVIGLIDKNKPNHYILSILYRNPSDDSNFSYSRAINEIEALKGLIKHEMTHFVQSVSKYATGSKKLPNYSPSKNLDLYEENYPNVRGEHKAWLESYIHRLDNLIDIIKNTEMKYLSPNIFKECMTEFEEQSASLGFNSQMKKEIYTDLFKFMNRYFREFSKNNLKKLKKAGFPV